MKIATIALTTALALTSTFALAQSSTGGSTSGAPAAAAGAKGDSTGPTGRPSGDAEMQKNQGTTGTSRNSPSGAGDASTSGAPSGAPVNNKGTNTEPGAVQNGKNSR